MEITLIWNPQWETYVEDGEQEGILVSSNEEAEQVEYSEMARWNPATGWLWPTCHTWTVDEVEDFIGEDGFVVIGGPLSTVEPSEFPPHLIDSTQQENMSEYMATQAGRQLSDEDEILDFSEDAES